MLISEAGAVRYLQKLIYYTYTLAAKAVVQNVSEKPKYQYQFVRCCLLRSKCQDKLISSQNLEKDTCCFSFWNPWHLKKKAKIFLGKWMPAAIGKHGSTPVFDTLSFFFTILRLRWARPRQKGTMALHSIKSLLVSRPTVQFCAFNYASPDQSRLYPMCKHDIAC